MAKQPLIGLLASGPVLFAAACAGQARATPTAFPDRPTLTATSTATPPPDTSATVAAAVAATVDALPSADARFGGAVC